MRPQDKQDRGLQNPVGYKSLLSEAATVTLQHVFPQPTLPLGPMAGSHEEHVNVHRSCYSLHDSRLTYQCRVLWQSQFHPPHPLNLSPKFLTCCSVWYTMLSAYIRYPTYAECCTVSCAMTLPPPDTRIHSAVSLTLSPSSLTCFSVW